MHSVRGHTFRRVFIPCALACQVIVNVGDSVVVSLVIRVTSFER